MLNECKHYVLTVIKLWFYNRLWMTSVVLILDILMSQNHLQASSNHLEVCTGSVPTEFSFR